VSTQPMYWLADQPLSSPRMKDERNNNITCQGRGGKIAKEQRKVSP
jgi:hypothetical protein